MTAPNGSARTARWGRTAAAGLALALAAMTAAQAEPVATSYPRSRAVADVAGWLASDTPLSPSQVVDVGPSAVTAVTSSSPTGSPRGFLANIAAEALDPSIGRQEEIVSWTIPVEVDCEKRLVRLGDMTGYSTRDLKSAPRVVRPADTSWVAPSSNAPLGAVMRALCDRDFQRPFATGVNVARGSDSKPARTPPPGPPPIVVAEKPATKPTPLATAAAANASPAPVTAAIADAKPAPATKAAIGHGASPFAVQVGASPSQDDAKAILARLEKKPALKGFKTDIQAAQVDGKTVYRALISGFAASSDANALCAQLKAGGQPCFVRH